MVRVETEVRMMKTMLKEPTAVVRVETGVRMVKYI